MNLGIHAALHSPCSSTVDTGTDRDSAEASIWQTAMVCHTQVEVNTAARRMREIARLKALQRTPYPMVLARLKLLLERRDVSVYTQVQFLMCMCFSSCGYPVCLSVDSSRFSSDVSRV